MNSADQEGVCILLVEDIDLNQMIAKEMLEDAGAKVVVADSGLEALHELSLGTNLISY